jgi:hypothetical protein
VTRSIAHISAIFLGLTISYSSYYLLDIYASPSFPRQHITDPTDDWGLIPITDNTDCNVTKSQIPISDIEEVTYSSDGKTLNITLWLSGLLEKVPNVFRSPNYSVFINSFSTNEGLDDMGEFEVTIFWNRSNDNLHGEWTKIVRESASLDNRVLLMEHNYTDFSENHRLGRSNATKSQINLSVDLGMLTSPQQYLILFNAHDSFPKGDGICFVSDEVVFGLAPPPDYSVIVSPKQIEMRPGEERTIEVLVNSSIIPLSNLKLSTTPTSNLRLEFIPTEQPLVPGGLTTSLMKIKMLEDTKTLIRDSPSAQLTLPIYARTSTEFSLPVSFGIYNLGPSPPELNLERVGYFTIEILQPLSIQEQFDIFWDRYGGLKTIVITIVGTAFLTAFFGEKVKRRHQTT